MKKAVILICSAAALLLSVFLIGQQIRKLKENPYNDVFAALSSSSVESISLIVRHPFKEEELSDSDLEKIIPLLNQIKLGALDAPSDGTTIGESRPVYYPLHIKLYDGTDIILEVGSAFIIVWSETSAYYRTTIPMSMKGPESYPINIFANSFYQEILSLADSLYKQYYPE